MQINWYGVVGILLLGISGYVAWLLVCGLITLVRFLLKL
jgi:hypothetical protein